MSGTAETLYHNIDAVLLKRKADAIHAVVAVIRMLFEDLFDLDRNKLTAAVLILVSQSAVIPAYAAPRD
jgi:hypothetical protein